MVGNIDAVVAAQAPKLAPFIAEMESRLAAACVDPARVNVKATTTEGLGLREGEGTAAYATSLLLAEAPGETAIAGQNCLPGDR